MTNIDANSELTVVRDLQSSMRETVVLSSDDDSTSVNTPRSILQSALLALGEGRISDAVAQFDDCFKFNDHALALEFTDKPRLTEFFQKARELFPDTVLGVVSLMQSGNRAIAEWRLTATQTLRYGSMSQRIRIDLHGSTIVRVEHRRIMQWSDYYDQSSSRRMGLASYFTEWIEY